jgi:predicted RND superfamily exporter protein
MSKSIPTKVNIPKINVNDTIKKSTSSVTKWLPFICAGTAVGVSILALKELKKIKNEMSVVKNQQINTTVKSDPLLNKKMEQLEEQLKKINEYLMNNNPKNPKIMKNVVKTEIPKEVKIINEPEEGVEYEEVEVTDDEDSDDEK